MRIDRYLSNMGLGSRSEIKRAISKKRVLLNGDPVKRSDERMHPGIDCVTWDGDEVLYEPLIYVMLNKPQGVITATKDGAHETVIDVLGDTYGSRTLSPVGRLDKDTEGFLILTDDGKFNHRIMSPKKHVNKKYFAEIQGLVTKATVSKFKNGLTIDGDEKCMPSVLEIIEVKDEMSQVYVTLQEGKYHQVKRMFEAVDMEVVYLKRVKIGGLDLDESLDLGEHRLMTEEEIESIIQS